ncbi:hypothetical protein L2K20_24945 [Mycobacterium sp. MBM]|nr:hypothetical protein [Mycobacterium sp. MBM]
MRAAPARHRVTRGPESRDGRQRWPASELLTSAGAGKATSHARRQSGNYALPIGRVGALAVSLGVGFAIAGAAQPAYADAGTASSGDSSGAGSSSSGAAASDSAATSKGSTDRPGVNRKRGPKTAAKPSVSNDIPETDDIAETDEDPELTETDEDPVLTEPGTPDPEEESTEAVPAEPTERPGATGGRKASPHSEIEKPVEVQHAVTSALQAIPEPSAESVAPVVADTGDAAAQAPVIEVAPAPAIEDAKPTVGAVTPKMTAASAALGTQSATPPNPLDVLVNTMMAWVARQISHTFVNRTPVAGPIVYEQNVLGQVYIDLNATDPNGDILSYEIIQPEKGWVYRDLISGKFVYTPWALVTGQPLTDSFKIVIHDDTEHLPGVLGQIQTLVETVTRFLGIAEADNLTVTIPVTVDPVYQAPPLVTPIAGGGHTIGGAPAPIVSTVDIVDGDSTRLKRVVIKIVTLAQDGDVLGYDAPADNPVVGSWDPETLTLTLTGAGTLAQYEEAIKAVTFSASQGALLVRGLSISATDEDDVDNIAPGSVLVGVWPAPTLPPLVTPIAGGGFTIGGSPAKIVSAVDIADGDSGKLAKLTVKIVTFAQSGDTLSYVAPEGNPVIASWNAADFTLTLTGAGTLAQYEEALKAVTFTATQGAALVRGLSISATDEHGIANIAPGFVTVGVSSPTRYVPLVTPIGGRSYTIGESPVKPVASVSIVDADSSHLQKVTMSVTTFGKSGDTLAFGGLPDNPITATYDAGTRTLTLSGIATKQQYEDALKAVTFTATQGGWTTRTLLIVATDTDGVNSSAGALTVSVW